MRHSHAIIIDDFDRELKPLVRIIDDWFENRRLALLFEVKVGNGKMIVSGIDFWQDMQNRPEARQLLYSIQKYMAGNDFRPKVTLSVESIRSLFKKPTAMSDAQIIYCDSEVRGFEAENAIDDDPNTFWHTPWDGDVPKYPHEIQIDLGKEIEIKGISLLPRQDGITGGWISKAQFYLSNDGKNWGKPLVTANFDFDKQEKTVKMARVYKTKYIRFVALEGFQNQDFASLSELMLIKK
jgi:hypothetical protein